MDPVSVVVGAALVVLGAVGATVTQRRLEAEGRARMAPLWLIPFGVLIGAGAAMVRGWDLWVAIIVGAVVIPLVGVMGRLWERRRTRRNGSRRGFR
jgi:hypothetical protein